MARLTLFPVRLNAYTRTDYSYISVVNAWDNVASATRDSDSVPMCAGVTLLDIRVHSIRTIDVALGEEGISHFADPNVGVLAVVLHEGEEEKVRPFVPIGWVMERIWLEDDVERFCVRIDELHLLNTWDNARFDENVYLSHHPDKRLIYLDMDQMHERERKVRSLLRDKFWQNSNIRVSVDVRDERDHHIVLTVDAQRVSSSGKTGINSLAFYDSAHPKTNVKVPSQCYDDITPAKLIHYWRSEIPDKRVGGFLGLDDNYRKPALERARQILGVHRPSHADKPASGRRVALDIRAPVFPLATRCIVGSLMWLRFAINASTANYRPMVASDQDHMLIHRDNDCWRFIFVCHYELYPNIEQTIHGSMVMPYIVEDRECAAKLPALSIQRGMPPAITSAIAETPFCASAISHGLARLKYARSVMAPFHTKGGKRDKFNYPEFGALFRSRETGSVFYGADNKASGKLKWDEPKMRPTHTITELVEGLRPNLINWDQIDDRPISSVLGASVHKPRAVVLDM